METLESLYETLLIMGIFLLCIGLATLVFGLVFTQWPEAAIAERAMSVSHPGMVILIVGGLLGKLHLTLEDRIRARRTRDEQDKEGQ